MLSGSFEDKLDFFAESVNRTSALNFRRLFERQKTYVPDRKRNIILHQNIVIISVCDRGDSFEAYTRACGKRTLAPYTAPLRAALRSVRRGFKFGLSAMASRVSLIEKQLVSIKVNAAVISHHDGSHDHRAFSAGRNNF